MPAAKLTNPPAAGTPVRGMLAGTVLALIALPLCVLAISAFEGSPLLVRGGSMMHRFDEPTWGRVGTIDPGDVVFLRAPAGPIQTLAEGGPARYGAPGEVIAYRPAGDPTRSLVIHRALTWIEVQGEGEARTYAFAWPRVIDRPECREGACAFGARGIVWPEKGFLERVDGGWKPPRSGYLTQGDNPSMNPWPDPVLGITCAGKPAPDCPAVEPEWIAGVARGEVPWLGLLPLALAGSPDETPAGVGWIRLGAVHAPAEIWTALGVVVLAAAGVGAAASRTVAHWRKPDIPAEGSEPPVLPSEAN